MLIDAATQRDLDVLESTTPGGRSLWSVLDRTRSRAGREHLRRQLVAPDHATAARTMSGFGGVVSFEVKGDLARTSRFVDATRLCTIAPSLGGPETLIEQPALMSFYELTTEEREAIGMKDNLVRLAVGLEDAEDLWDDLAQALAHEAVRP